MGSDWPLRSDTNTEPLADAAAAETEDMIEDDSASTSAASHVHRPQVHGQSTMRTRLTKTLFPQSEQ